MHRRLWQFEIAEIIAGTQERTEDGQNFVNLDTAYKSWSLIGQLLGVVVDEDVKKPT